MIRAVYGMGIALINNWTIINKKFKPQYGIDNNKSKWNTVDKYTGLECISLETAQKFGDLEILITVGDPYAVKQISEQLKEAEIPFYVLTEMLERWCISLSLPDHLDMMAVEEKKILLFNTPEHDNVGDHLIALSELDFLKKHFGDYSLYEVTDIEYLWYHNVIKERVTSKDVILITGGGFLGSLWLYNGENNVRRIISEYPYNRIIVLPQTIYFENNSRGIKEMKKSEEIYQSHKNIIFCAREEQSYNQFIKMIGNNGNIKLLPDMALFYSYKSMKKEKSKIAIVCMRSDKEKMIDDICKSKIIEIVEKQGYEIRMMSMHSGQYEGIEGRQRQVDQKLQEIEGADIVITDTLHCMISAAIVGTKCIALNNLSGKVKNVYKWIDSLEYIFFCETAKEVYSIILNKDNFIGNYRLGDREKYERELELIVRGGE